MPRPPRPLIAGGVYHVFNRGVVRLPIFIDTLDRVGFLALLGDIVERYSWKCLAYCLMGNHFHLLVETPSPDLDQGMQRLQSLYALDFNRRYEREGHLFHRRYGASVLAEDDRIRHVARYVVQNPVGAGLCRHPGDWPWSSHRATLGHVRRPSFLAAERLLGLFGGQSDYRDFVEPAIRRRRSQGPLRGPASAPRRST
jgi:REP element-mobilizing transposase RayT